jgi:DNA repair protein RadC
MQDKARQPRERLLDGAQDLTDAELLAVLLQPDAGRALLLAESLLERFGGLRALLDAPAADIGAARGVGNARLACLIAVRALAVRYFEQSLPVGRSIRSPADTEAFLKARLRDRAHEVFCCIYLDNRHRVLGFEELFRGTIDGTSVYPREVVREALDVNAAAVILAHNHPSGVAEPSRADERITRRIRSALELVDIRLLDHLVIGDGSATSLAARGLI